MSKRNISYIKPQDPNFLRKLKEQIGYKEGPTVDTKREDLGAFSDEDNLNDDQPTVVVLEAGDLTAEEASKAEKDLEKEKTEAPADLSARIVFKTPKKAGETSQGKKRSSEKLDKIKNKKSKTKSLLSFEDEETEEY